MSYWIGMFNVRSFFFRASSSFCVAVVAVATAAEPTAVVVFFFAFSLCVSFTVFLLLHYCHSSRFSFLLAIIFCTRPNGVFLIRFVFLSLFANRHVLFVCHRFSLWPFCLCSCFCTDLTLARSLTFYAPRPAIEQSTLWNREAMAIPIIKNKANENEKSKEKMKKKKHLHTERESKRT